MMAYRDKVKKEDYTKSWKRYDTGRRWNNSLQNRYYDTITTNWEFYNGNQWVNATGLSSDLPQPVFNILKRSLLFFVSMMTSSSITGEYKTQLMRDDDYQDLDNMTAIVASADFKNYLERIKIDMLARDLLVDAGVTGDMAYHMYFDRNAKPYGLNSIVEGQIEIETIDGVNLYMSNPNSRDVQKQQYIGIYGRDTVDNIKQEIKFHQKLKSLDELVISPDSETEDQESIDGKQELDSDEFGKVGYVLEYCKKRNKKGIITVHATKSLVDRVIFEDVDTGLYLYPISFNNWEHQKNQCHGRGLVTDIVPNQIFVNRMFAMAMYHLQQTAFPKAVYDRNMISGWSNAIGSAIAINRQPGESIFNMAGYLQPATMSPQITQLIEMTIKYTKEMIGANDALLGDINPEQASGAAISVTARQSGVPLEGPKSNLYEMIEDMMHIYADMAGTYYGSRPIVADMPEIGKQVVEFDFAKLKDMQFNVNVDVGATTYYSQIAQQATLDNLLANGMIEFADYLERVPEGFVPEKQGLITKIKEKAELMAQQAQMQMPVQPDMGMQAPPM